MVTLRLTEEEHGALVRMAESDGVSQSDVLRRLLRARIAVVEGSKPRRSPKKGKDDYVTVDLDPYTIVHDPERNGTFMRINGLVPLPVGAEIELTEPNVNARVTRVRLLAGDPATLCIDVQIPKKS